MKKNITLKKGLNLNLAGSVVQGGVKEVNVRRVAVTPDDFPGFMPKLDVQPGDVVKAGQPLLHDKNAEAMKLCSPVAGKVVEVVRGARRKIERVVVECDAAAAADVVTLPDDMPVKELLLASGLWPWMRQRPYDIVPSPDVKPRDIFVTALDTAPLAVDYIVPSVDVLVAGVKALCALTDGKVYIGVAADSDFPAVAGAEVVGFNRLHPAGNAGVQAANIAPVNKGEVIWTLSLDALARIGLLVIKRRADFSATVALTGSEVKTPCVLSTVAGAEIKPLVEGRLAAEGHKRIISGNVLTGVPVGEDGYLRFPYR
ncbi:MAG: NADH:ubiquinone reductase (Na(+)-transporting) subunit A, partial [Duncaniella sp.]|nr:NADH:ubiquinone reductase (Na(+)-transporting) subunit A [Duncaniella sp.]